MSNRKKLRIAAATVAVGGLALAGGALATSASAATATAPTDTPPANGAAGYNFFTLNNAKDTTFNQLLGINNKGEIAGYFGSGAAGHPNKGYLLTPPDGQANYASENFPGSVQTQVTGINDKGDTVGFWSSMNNASMINDNHGFYKLHGGGFHTADFPTGTPAKPPVDQLLGINNSDVAVGFWTDAADNSHGYELNIGTGKYSSVTDPGAPGTSLTAAAINNNGDVAGIYTNPATGATDGFLKAHGQFTDLAVPGAVMTQALGVNDHDEVVGTYQTGTLEGARLHGFTWTPAGGFTTIEDPNVGPSGFPGVNNGETTVNGVNDEGVLVGFYLDANGITNGFLAAPRPASFQVPLTAMPQGTVTFGRSSQSDTVDLTVSVTGLTPGSSHAVTLVNGAGGVITQFTTLTANSAGVAQETLESGYKFSIGGWRVLIHNGNAGDPVSAEPIAETSPYVAGVNAYQLTPVEVDASGVNHGTPQGQATVTYDPAAQSIFVTVNASGLTPGAHAAHIHLGSCQSQGPVEYMLMDFTANSAGQIVNQTQTVTGVSTPLPATGWYLNLHQGDSASILSNGQPTINFRPLLCGNG